MRTPSMKTATANGRSSGTQAGSGPSRFQRILAQEPTPFGLMST